MTFVQFLAGQFEPKKTLRQLVRDRAIVETLAWGALLWMLMQ